METPERTTPEAFRPCAEAPGQRYTQGKRPGAARSLAAVSARFYPLWLELMAAPGFVLAHWALRRAVESATRRVLAPPPADVHPDPESNPSSGSALARTWPSWLPAFCLWGMAADKWPSSHDPRSTAAEGPGPRSLPVDAVLAEPRPDTLPQALPRPAAAAAKDPTAREAGAGKRGAAAPLLISARSGIKQD